MSGLSPTYSRRSMRRSSPGFKHNCPGYAFKVSKLYVTLLSGELLRDGKPGQYHSSRAHLLITPR
ncbi:unnamed protein product [Dovyalis caffra]|uniref:Uncharacterized protein n=1 Tax=Dovyalis caffra TaxID=77055 RepID=A0AAV1RKR4_9ROSI|nr:unnamed protein product [Dovyalis caffra]